MSGPDFRAAFPPSGKLMMATAGDVHAHLTRPPSPEERRSLFDMLRRAKPAPAFPAAPAWRPATPEEFARALFSPPKPRAAVVVSLDLARVRIETLRALRDDTLPADVSVAARGELDRRISEGVTIR
jgi:hypothetical protein